MSQRGGGVLFFALTIFIPFLTEMGQNMVYYEGRFGSILSNVQTGFTFDFFLILINFWLKWAKK